MLSVDPGVNPFSFSHTLWVLFSRWLPSLHFSSAAGCLLDIKPTTTDALDSCFCMICCTPLVVQTVPKEVTVPGGLKQVSGDMLLFQVTDLVSWTEKGVRVFPISCSQVASLACSLQRGTSSSANPGQKEHPVELLAHQFQMALEHTSQGNSALLKIHSSSRRLKAAC